MELTQQEALRFYPLYQEATIRINASSIAQEQAAIAFIAAFGEFDLFVYAVQPLFAYQFPGTSGSLPDKSVWLRAAAVQEVMLQFLGERTGMQEALDSLVDLDPSIPIYKQIWDIDPTP